jgi:GWxTD domain-containing protein
VKRIFGMVRFIVVVAALLLMVPASAQYPQRDGAGNPGERMQQAISYEVVTLPSADSLRTRVDVFYRVDRAFFIAVRNQDASIPYPFVRRGEISIDRSGKEGIPQGKSVQRVEIGETAPDPETPGDRKWYTGAFSFEMPPGPLTFRFLVDDLESKRSFVEGPRNIDVPSFAVTPAADPVFVIHGTDSLTLAPLNYGGDLLFGSGSELLIAWRSRGSGPVSVQYSFTVREPDGPGAVVLTDSLDGARPMTGYALTLRGDSGRAEYRLVPDSASHLAILVVPFAAQTLPLRPYTLTVWVKEGNRLRELPKTFRMVWPDMPFSLRDVDFALQSLRHITTPSELDSLMSGGFEQERENLERFWKKRDPTPATAFNEVMAQYYRRVDHSIRAFATLKQPDGSRTDRGRIYILYGQPTNVDRTLDPPSGREVWTYSRLKKRFTFVDATKTGAYVLVSTDTL